MSERTGAFTDDTTPAPYTGGVYPSYATDVIIDVNSLYPSELKSLSGASILRTEAAWAARKEADTPVVGADARDEIDVKASLRRRKRTRRQVETSEYLGAARRFIRGAGRRVADGDEVELRELIELQQVLDAAILEGVKGIRARGMSWQYIANAQGITREAAYQKWGKK